MNKMEILDLDLRTESVSHLPYTKEQIELAQLMSEYSEDEWSAVWMSGLGDFLWKAINSDNITDPRIVRIKEMSDQTNSWWDWGEESPDVECFSLEEWASASVDALYLPYK